MLNVWRVCAASSRFLSGHLPISDFVFRRGFRQTLRMRVCQGFRIHTPKKATAHLHDARGSAALGKQCCFEFRFRRRVAAWAGSSLHLAHFLPAP